MKSYFNYVLEKPVKVSIEGRDEECTNLLVKSPRPRDDVKAMSLEAIVTQSLMKAFADVGSKMNKELKDTVNKAGDEKKDEGIEADGMISMLMMGADEEKIARAMFLIKELLCEGNKENPQCEINNVKLTKPLFDEISIRDKKAILGRYIFNFLSSTLTQ